MKTPPQPHPLAVNPTPKAGFVLTNKKGQQEAIQVHFLAEGQVFCCIWLDSVGLVGSCVRIPLEQWQKDLSDVHIDDSQEAWAAFYEKQNK